MYTTHNSNPITYFLQNNKRTIVEEANNYTRVPTNMNYSETRFLGAHNAKRMITLG